MGALKKKTSSEFLKILLHHPMMKQYDITHNHIKQSINKLILDMGEVITEDIRTDLLERFDLKSLDQELDNLMSDLISHLPYDQRNEILLQVAIGELQLIDPNAFSSVPEEFRPIVGDIAGEYEGYLIGIHSGLISILHKVAYLLFSCVTVVKTRQVDTPNNDPEAVSMPKTLSLDEGARKLHLIIKQSINPASAINVEIPIIRDERIWLAGKAALAAQKFVIAHEISHIMLGHVGNPSRHLTIQNYQIPTYACSLEHRREFEADFNAMCLMLDSALGKEDDFGLVALVNGVEFCLFVLQMREITAGLCNTRTHPSAKDRLNRLRKDICLPSHYYEFSNVLISFAEQALVKSLSSE